MKVIHWSILFIVLILPFSIICRNIISDKNIVLQDQTRVDNALDVATYDAVEQLVEVAEFMKTQPNQEKLNLVINHDVAMASINRFFQSIAVNFNLPSKVEIAKEYFGQYIPVVVIVGYDGLYVYSYDYTDQGYQYVLKPKIPFAYTDPATKAMINFTLGNDLKIYMPGQNLYLEGYLSEVSNKELEDIRNIIDTFSTIAEKRKFITENLSSDTSNLSLNLKIVEENFNGTVKIPDFILHDNVTQDYEYDSQNEVINENEVSDFHKLRRDTIINLITNVLKEEVNEHDTYADIIGVNYDFMLPTIDKEQWQNTINDISVLAFFQGMPIGTDSYYNNYSLGGARIVQAHDLYGNTINGQKLYHKHNCPLLLGDNDTLDYDDYDLIFINVKDANENGYYACKECR